LFMPSSLKFAEINKFGNTLLEAECIRLTRHLYNHDIMTYGFMHVYDNIKLSGFLSLIINLLNDRLCCLSNVKLS